MNWPSRTYTAPYFLSINDSRGGLSNFSVDKNTFDQEGFAEAKAYKKPGKIYCFSTFRGHRDSIIKRPVK